MMKAGGKVGKHTGRTRRPRSRLKRIQRTSAFKRFKEQNLENLQAEIEAEAKKGTDDRILFKEFLRNEANPEARALLIAFAKTPEAKEVERQIKEPNELMMLRRVLRDEIIFRSDTFRRWCQEGDLPTWPAFLNLFSYPRRARTTRGEEEFSFFLATKGKRGAERLKERLYRKGIARGYGIKDLMPSTDCVRPNCPELSGLAGKEKRIAGFHPLKKALFAYDMSKRSGSIPIDIHPQGLICHYTTKEQKLMEITRLLFPQTKGKHPAYDDEANRCLQQVKRWIDKVGELIRLVDAP